MENTSFVFNERVNDHLGKLSPADQAARELRRQEAVKKIRDFIQDYETNGGLYRKQEAEKLMQKPKPQNNLEPDQSMRSASPKPISWEQAAQQAARTVHLKYLADREQMIRDARKADRDFTKEKLGIVDRHRSGPEQRLDLERR